MNLVKKKNMGSFKEGLLLVLIYLIFFQDYIGLLIFNVQSSLLVVKFFLALKDVIILFFLLSGFLVTRQFRFSWTLLYMSFYSATVLIYFFTFPNSNLTDLRSLLFPFYCMLAGYFFKDFARDRFVYHFRFSTLMSAIIALIVYFMGPELLIKWRLLEYTEQGRGYVGLVTRGLPATFYNFFGGIDFYRFAAGIMNPIATASLMIFALNMLFGFEITSKIKNPSWIYWVLVLAIALTFSRGPIVGAVVAMSVGLIFWKNRFNSQVWGKFFKAGALILLLIVLGAGTLKVLYLSSVGMQDSSSKDHYLAIINSWEYLQRNWMGAGVGSSGQWSHSDAGGAGENSYAMIIGQVGLVAFFFLMMSYICIVRKLLKRKDHFLSFGLFLTFLMILINAFFSPIITSVTPLTLFWFLIGYFEATAAIKEKEVI